MEGDLADSDNHLNGRKVLLVEDSPVISDSTEMMLQDMGCEVIGPVGTMAPALIHAEEEALDAAVVDINIRGGKAYALLAVFIVGTKAFFSQKTPFAAESAKPAPQGTSGQESIVLTVLTLSSVHLLISICALGIPWRLAQIGGTEFHVGLAFSIAAAIEVPIIAGSNAIRNRFGYARILLLSCALLCVYFLTAALMENLFGLISLSVINGIVTGTMMGLSLIVLQERLADRPAHASSIYSNILRLSYVGALLVAGVIAQIISVVAIFWIAGVMAFCLCVGLVVWRPFGSMDAFAAEAPRHGQS